MATQPQEQDDEFSAAFASFANPADPAKADPADAGLGGGDEPVLDPVLDPDAGDAGGAIDPVLDPDAGDAGGGDGDPVVVTDPVVAPVADDGATDALIARLAGLVKDAPAAPAPAPQAQAVAEEIYSQDEKEFLAEYDKEWADVTRGEALKRRADNNQLVKYIFNQVASELRPYLDTIETMSSRAHLGDIKAAVGDDYDDIRDKVVAWALSADQPMYLQNAYKQVIQGGTAEEVNDLISRYRQATGPIQAPAKVVSELSNDAKKAAQALAPVSTKRSVIPQDDDNSDFDSAFARFSAGLGRS